MEGVFSMKRWFAFSLVVAAVAGPTAAVAVTTGAGAATFKGVVVSLQPARHAMVVAQANGVVRTVHARVLQQAGTKVSITASRLRNGTFSAARVRAFGRATKAKIHGVIVRAVRRGYLVSAGGSVLRILSPTRRTAAVDTTPLVPGTPVTATVSIGDNDELQAEDIEEVQPVETEPANTEPIQTGTTQSQPTQTQPTQTVPGDDDQGEDQQGDVNEDGDGTTSTTQTTLTSTTPTTPDDSGDGSSGGND
jgi:hypothetical protein